MKPNTPRTVLHENVSYSVVRLYSSGIGNQYACTWKDGNGKLQTLLLTEELVDRHSEHVPLYRACAKRFDDHLTFAKYLGSSSFPNAKLPPDGITKKE
ncbi:MAG: hypothetical protein H7301_04825 [Cryobacterium sp.]|nr:hypothetical protein [Oligoflexia bacterium]